MLQRLRISKPQVSVEQRHGGSAMICRDRKWLVLQMGARMHYAVPAILARRGMLAEFWTDMHAGDWPARLVQWAPSEFLRPRLIRGMLGRRIPAEIQPDSVKTFPVRTLWHRLRGQYVDPSINKELLTRGFGHATGLYSVMFGDAEVIRVARQMGLCVTFEQVISPEHPAIMTEERARFQGIEAQESPENEAFYLTAHRQIWRDSTSILAPSNYVREGIGRLGGNTRSVCLVPYAVSESWFRSKPRPEPGRVLFVGSVGLRKGSQYLAQAARLLKERQVRCQIRVVGPVSRRLAADPRFAGPTYVGQIPRTEVREEFLRADVFVLPTLAEGSATAHIEALACGIPVVTTPNCGTLVQDGAEGFVVPIRDATALADRIEALVTNRQLRDEMSARARELAVREHTWERYEERLVEALVVGGAASQIVAESSSSVESAVRAIAQRRGIA
jgi:glycosyltransferase involved in cell wall biosynthesis